MGSFWAFFLSIFACFCGHFAGFGKCFHWLNATPNGSVQWKVITLMTFWRAVFGCFWSFLHPIFDHHTPYFAPFWVDFGDILG